MTWRSALTEFRKGLPIHEAGVVSKRLIWGWVIRLVCAFIFMGIYGILVYNIQALEKENTQLKADCGRVD